MAKVRSTRGKGGIYRPRTQTWENLPRPARHPRVSARAARQASLNVSQVLGVWIL
jgi:hypothetical protein